MNKQAYLRMMTYGMHKNASLRERELLYKIAMMTKLLGWLDIKQWWKDGGSIKNAWAAIIEWFKRLFGSGSNKNTNTNTTSGTNKNTHEVNAATQEMINAKDPAARDKAFYRRRKALFGEDKSTQSPAAAKSPLKAPVSLLEAPLVLSTPHIGYPWLDMSSLGGFVNTTIKDSVLRVNKQLELEDIKKRYMDQKYNLGHYSNFINFLKKKLNRLRIKMTSTEDNEERNFLFKLRRSLLKDLEKANADFLIFKKLKLDLKKIPESKLNEWKLLKH